MPRSRLPTRARERGHTATTHWRERLMALRVSDPPNESVTALRESLDALATRGSFSDRGLRTARPDQLSATVPHAVFNLTLDDAMKGRTEAARQTGWRYLLAVDEQVLASAETRTEGGRQVFSH